ncbi:MAG: DUF1657 domain-containing protein [Bacillota bacterium]
MTVSSQVKQTLAALKGSQGTLRIYAAQAQNEKEEEVYLEAIAVTSQIIQDMENRIKTLEFEEPQYKGL